MARVGSHAVFPGAGGDHHHLGANTWQGAGASPAPEGTARLERFTIRVPGGDTTELIDLFGNRLVVAPA